MAGTAVRAAALKGMKRLRHEGPEEKDTESGEEETPEKPVDEDDGDEEEGEVDLKPRLKKRRTRQNKTLQAILELTNHIKKTGEEETELYKKSVAEDLEVKRLKKILLEEKIKHMRGN